MDHCPMSCDSSVETPLMDFPTITSPYNGNVQIKYDGTHHIETKGPLVHVKPQRLAPERLKIAKQEFQHMSELGVIRPSSSNWASPLHMVPKKTAGDWRPVWDYRTLNNATIPDRYPILHIQDVIATLHEGTVFSRTDLV